MYITGTRISAIWNRNPSLGARDENESRVLRISAPKKYFNPESLAMFFSQHFLLTLIRLKLLDEDQCNTQYKWEFASLKAQAAAARLAINNHPLLQQFLSVIWTRGSCE
jgi:hypothetical protein